MVMGRNGYGPILSWAEMVMGRKDQLPFVQVGCQNTNSSLIIVYFYNRAGQGRVGYILPCSNCISDRKTICFFIIISNSHGHARSGQCLSSYKKDKI